MACRKYNMKLNAADLGVGRGQQILSFDSAECQKFSLF